MPKRPTQTEAITDTLLVLADVIAVSGSPHWAMYLRYVSDIIQSGTKVNAKLQAITEKIETMLRENREPTAIEILGLMAERDAILASRKKRTPRVKGQPRKSTPTAIAKT